MCYERSSLDAAGKTGRWDDMTVLAPSRVCRWRDGIICRDDIVHLLRP